jgi:hypothetical protein
MGEVKINVRKEKNYEYYYNLYYSKLYYSNLYFSNLEFLRKQILEIFHSELNRKEDFFFKWTKYK